MIGAEVCGRNFCDNTVWADSGAAPDMLNVTCLLGCGIAGCAVIGAQPPNEVMGRGGRG